MPAQLAAAMTGCFVLTQWEHQKRRYVTVLVALQCVLSVATVGAELYYRFSEKTTAIPATSRWIARNTPTTALVFYEQDQDPATHGPWDRLLEVNYGQRLSYVNNPDIVDHNFTPAPSNAWLCLPEVNLYDASSLCSIEAHIPGTQPVFIKYLSSAPSLDGVFTPVHESANGSIFSLTCPNRATPEYPNPPTVVQEPYQELRASTDRDSAAPCHRCHYPEGRKLVAPRGFWTSPFQGSPRGRRWNSKHSVSNRFLVDCDAPTRRRAVGQASGF